jgi:hypothetical protein
VPRGLPFRPVAPKEFLVVGRDLRSLMPGLLNTFEIDIPVAAGDVIGDQDANASSVKNACSFENEYPGDVTLEAEGDGTPGTTASRSTNSENPSRTCPRRCCRRRGSPG